MAKYLSRRVIKLPQERLTADRYQYLGLNQAEPNLGDPPGDSPPIGQQYILVAVDTNPGRRYWQQLPPGVIDRGITVRDEGDIVGLAGSITQLNFVGSGVTVTPIDTSGDFVGVATITITASISADEP